MAQETQFKVAEVKVSYKADYKITDRPKISQSSEGYALLKQQWDSNRIELVEEFKIILLNTSNRVLGIADISRGGVSGTLIDPKIVFAIALKTNSSKIILSHNHPSGNLQPSNADIVLTKRLKDGGKLLDIEVCDHIIISNYGYYSFADECMM